MTTPPATPSPDATLAAVAEIGLFPPSAQRIQRVANEPGSNNRMLAEAIQLCPLAAARLLKLANSAFYGGRHVTSLTDAVALIGYAHARDFAVAMAVGTALGQHGPLAAELWAHSTRVGIALGLLSRYVRCIDRNAGLTGGILHDMGLIGMLALTPNFAQVYRNLGGDGHPKTLMAERAHFGMTHAELGSQLLRQWGLPTALADIAGVHHNDFQDPLAAACQFAEHLADSDTAMEPSRLMEHPLAARLDLRTSQMEIIVDVYREELMRLSDLV